MHEPAFYRSQAARFRALAEGSDAETATALRRLAASYEAEASRQETPAVPPEVSPR